MRKTGIKDRNGTDITEGDMVSLAGNTTADDSLGALPKPPRARRLNDWLEPTHNGAIDMKQEPQLAWTDHDMKKPWGAEIASLRHLAADPALNMEQAMMLRHCAKRMESTATTKTVANPPLSLRLRIAARALIRERVVYAEDVETLCEA